MGPEMPTPSPHTPPSVSPSRATSDSTVYTIMSSAWRGRREVDRDVDALAHLAGQVDEDAGQVVAVEIEPDRVGGVGVDRERGRRRPPALLPAFGLEHEPVAK